MWYTKENYETVQKVPQLATKNSQSYLYFLQNFGLKISKPSETSKNHSDGPKNPEIIQKLSIFYFPNWRDHRHIATQFSCRKRALVWFIGFLESQYLLQWTRWLIALGNSKSLESKSFVQRLGKNRRFQFCGNIYRSGDRPPGKVVVQGALKRFRAHLALVARLENGE